MYDTLVFDDGSVYTGTLKGGVPDGLGTCTWQVGIAMCLYSCESLQSNICLLPAYAAGWQPV